MSITDYAHFYIGITNDIERRLFSEHNVSQEEGSQWWIYHNANNETSARNIEKHFLSKGMQGGTGGGNSDCTWVYCYEISNDTIE
jgi:hypothetical protein